MSAAFVIADAHGNLDAVAGLLRQERILNDEWGREDYDTTVIQIGDLCNCVASSIADDSRCLDHVEQWLDIYLVGNHEHPVFGGPAFSGFYPDPVVAHRLRLLNSLGIVKPCVAVDGVLVSHAGLAEAFDDWAGNADAETFAKRVQDLWAGNPRDDVFSTIGRSRGGWSETGGLLWSDWRERKSRRFSQVVGHTVGDSIRWVKTREGQEPDGWFAVCIDLGAKDYGSRIAGAWVRDGKCDPVVYDPAIERAA